MEHVCVCVYMECICVMYGLYVCVWYMERVYVCVYDLWSMFVCVCVCGVWIICVCVEWGIGESDSDIVCLLE